MTQIREEVSFTKGRIIVRGKLVTRGKAKRADYVLYYKPNIPIAVIEAKDNNHSVGDGMQQALDYAETLEHPVRLLVQRRRLPVPRPDRNQATEIETESVARRVPVARKSCGRRYRAWKGLAAGGRKRSSCRTTSTMAAARSRATTSASPSTGDRGHRQGPEPDPARHGDRHGQDLHRVPDHLAAVEGRPQEAHPVPRRSQRARRPDDGQRLPAVRAGDGQAQHEHQDHRARRTAPRSNSPTAIDKQAADRHVLRDLSRPVPGDHRARRSGRRCSASSRPTSST